NCRISRVLLLSSDISTFEYSPFTNLTSRCALLTLSRSPVFFYIIESIRAPLLVESLLARSCAGQDLQLEVLFLLQQKSAFQTCNWTLEIAATPGATATATATATAVVAASTREGEN